MKPATIALVLVMALALPASANYLGYDEVNCATYEHAEGDGYVYNKTAWDITFYAGDATVTVGEVGGKILAGPAQRPFNNRRIPAKTWVRIWDSGEYKSSRSVYFKMNIGSSLDHLYDVRVNAVCDYIG